MTQSDIDEYQQILTIKISIGFLLSVYAFSFTSDLNKKVQCWTEKVISELFIIKDVKSQKLVRYLLDNVSLSTLLAQFQSTVLMFREKLI